MGLHATAPNPSEPLLTQNEIQQDSITENSNAETSGEEIDKEELKKLQSILEREKTVFT